MSDGSTQTILRPSCGFLWIRESLQACGPRGTWNLSNHAPDLNLHYPHDPKTAPEVAV